LTGFYIFNIIIYDIPKRYEVRLFMNDENLKSDIKKRLNRIEGQIRGIQKMIENDADCSNVLIQISAVRAAINKVGGIVLENYTKACIKKNAANCEDNESIENLIDTIIKFTKYNEVK
jgi:CsoR family transcriptional regulator, copper-sensing transcriptional repressor